MRRGLAWVALLLGVALILTAWTVQAVPGWAAAPGGLLVLLFFWWEKVLTWAERLQGLAGSTAPRPPTAAGAQAAAGDEGLAAAHTGTGDIVQVGSGVGKAHTVVQHLAPAPRRDLEQGGAPPAARSEVYVPRGIEDRVLQALEQHGLAAIVGLTGPGGVGKTHMAFYLAATLQQQGRVARVFWLTLAEREAEDLWADLAAQLGLDIRGLTPAQVQAEVRGRLAETCRERPCLVVLDDARPHHLENGLLRALLPPRPCLGLVTSRVRTLPVPETFPLDVMTEDQARELLRQVLGAEALAAEPQAVARLLELTRRHPLALDVAARRVRQRMREGHPTPVAAFVQQLERLGLPALQADLAVTRVLQLSLEMLPEDEQAAFRALAALDPAGFHLRHAAGLWGLDEAAAEARLERWYDLSLVQRLPEAQPRYRLHDLYHDLALHLLRARGETDSANARLAEYLLQEYEKYPLANVKEAPHLATAFPHLIAAIRWASKSTVTTLLLAQLLTTPHNWWLLRYRALDNWMQWLKKVETKLSSHHKIKSKILKSLGDITYYKGRHNQALEYYIKSLKILRLKKEENNLEAAFILQSICNILRRLGKYNAAIQYCQQALKIFDKFTTKRKGVVGKATTLQRIGHIYRDYGYIQQALQHYQRSLELYGRAKDILGQAYSYKAIGYIRYLQKDFTRALRLYNHALRIFHTASDYNGVADALKIMSLIYFELEQFEQSNEYWEKSYNIYKRLGNKLGLALLYQQRGNIFTIQAKYNKALQYYHQALEIFHQIGDRLGQAYTLAALSRLALLQGRDDEARRLLNQALEMHRAIGSRYGVATDHFNFGLVLLHLERPCEALPHLEQALEMYKALGLTALVARTERLLAGARETCETRPTGEEPGAKAAS